MQSSKVRKLTNRAFLKDARLALIHIPIRVYLYFLQPILRVLFGPDEGLVAKSLQTDSSSGERKTWMNRHVFLNVSLTPIECSVVCSRKLADEVFRPLAEDFNTFASGWEQRVGGFARSIVNFTNTSNREHEKILIYPDDYTAIEVNGQGDAGQRVLELTGPLAMAGM